MDAAKSWFTQPWRVAGGTKTLWYARFEAVREAEIKRMHKSQDEAKRARNNAR